MTPSWLRKKGDEDHDAVDDEPMAMLDLSAYDVPPERRGAFREAIAAGSDDTGRRWAKTATEPPG